MSPSVRPSATMTRACSAWRPLIGFPRGMSGGRAWTPRDTEPPLRTLDAAAALVVVAELVRLDAAAAHAGQGGFHPTLVTPLPPTPP